MNGGTTTALPVSSLSSITALNWPDTSRINHFVGHASGNEVGVGGQRRTAGCGRAKEDLILFEPRRFENDRRAVRKRPLDDARCPFDSLDDGAARRRRVHQGLAGGSVNVRLELLR